VWINVRYKKNGWRVIINPWDAKVISKINISEMTRAMNEKIEELVLEEPESYMWGYDRYKTPKKIFSENNK
jgi:lauroyl/myristoyl acyltransferase